MLCRILAMSLKVQSFLLNLGGDYKNQDAKLATAERHLINDIWSSPQQQSLPLKGPLYLLVSAAAMPGCLPLPKASLKLQ